MAVETGTLSAAMSSADKRVTVLDDRVDAEEHTAWLWLKAHKLHVPHKRIVIGTEALPNAWEAKTKKFVDLQAAHTYLAQFAHNHSAMSSLRAVAHILDTCFLLPQHDSGVLSTVAAGLMAGRAWVIELPASEPPSRFVGQIGSDISRKTNAPFGTKVDFNYICKIEGGQWLRGYVPFSKGKVAGRSGMTIGSGFDVGQWSTKELDELGLPKKVSDQIELFAAYNFKGLTKAQVAARVGKLGPVPQIEKQDADTTDTLVFSKMLTKAITAWNRVRKPGVPAFTALPPNWQTVWLSRVYQEGPGAATSFRQQAGAGKWQEAADSLGSQTSYKDRVQQESDMLDDDLPAPITPATRTPR